MGTELQVTGLNELFAQLEEKEKSVKKTQEEAIKKCAQLILDDAKATTAFKDRTGTLRKSLKMSRIKKSKDGDVSVYIGDIDKKAFYAKFIEFGYSRMPARPFLQPALQRNERQILQIIRRKIEEALGE